MRKKTLISTLGLNTTLSGFIQLRKTLEPSPLLKQPQEHSLTHIPNFLLKNSSIKAQVWLIPKIFQSFLIKKIHKNLLWAMQRNSHRQFCIDSWSTKRSYFTKALECKKKLMKCQSNSRFKVSPRCFLFQTMTVMNGLKNSMQLEKNKSCNRTKFLLNKSENNFMKN